MTELERAANDFALKNHSWLNDVLPTITAVKSFAAKSFIAGAKWNLENLWHDAQGDYLPIYDREVIVLCGDCHGGYIVCFGHRPPKMICEINILTGEENVYTPQTYDKGEWNIPNVRWWLDINIPKEE